jgi:hypothetical protein
MRRLVRQPAQVLPQARREGAELLESLFVFRVSSLPVPAPETVRETDTGVVGSAYYSIEQHSL